MAGLLHESDEEVTMKHTPKFDYFNSLYFSGGHPKCNRTLQEERKEKENTRGEFNVAVDLNI